VSFGFGRNLSNSRFLSITGKEFSGIRSNGVVDGGVLVVF